MSFNDDEYDEYEDDDDDEPVSTGTVYERALYLTGDPELAREASEMYPADFM